MRRRVACSYLPAVERHRDGDLGRAAVAELEAHPGSCPICREEQRSLDRLTAVLREGDVDGSVPKPEHERLRAVLLVRCNQKLTVASSSATSLSVLRTKGALRRRITVWESAVAVVTIVALAAILFPVFSGARERARRFAGRPLASGALIA